MSDQGKTERALVWFELESIEGISLDDLKRRFKKALSAHHPDRGGQEGAFEEIIEAYEYLSAFIKRLMGGRSHKAVIDVGDLIKQRDRDFVHEMNNMISDVFDEMERQKSSSFSMVFNEAFQKHADPLISDGGYDTWLRENDEKNVVNELDHFHLFSQDSNELIRRVQEEIRNRHLDEELLRQAQQDQGDEKQLPESFQQTFVEAVRTQHPERAPTGAIILHPMEMAIVDGRCYGTEIIRRENRYHSSMYVNPEYVDLYEAYTVENTVLDKLPEYQEHILPSVDEIIKERERIYEHLDDTEMKEIQEYEQRYFEKEDARIKEIQEYFKSTSSSVWALRDGYQTIYRDTGVDDEKKNE